MENIKTLEEVREFFKNDRFATDNLGNLTTIVTATGYKL